MVCQHKCVIDLTSETPGFICTHPETGKNKSEEIPAISHTVPTSALTDTAFAGILSLISKHHSFSKEIFHVYWDLLL